MEPAPQARATIDLERARALRSIHTQASPDTVWRTITEPELIAQWFGELRLDGTDAGARGTVNWPGQPAVAIMIEAMNTPHAISYRWRNEPDEPLEPLHEENSTVFTFTLTPRPDGTELTVVESGFQYTPDPQERLEGHRDGWDEKLDQLLALRELSS